MLTRLPPFDTYSAIAIEHVAPEVDGGRWPIKRVVGDTVQVAASVFKEGHDLIVVEVAYRTEAAADWQTAPMTLTENDRWVGQFAVTRNTRYVYTVQAYTDVFGSWRADLMKRVAAGQRVPSELLEGRRLVEKARLQAAPVDAHTLDASLRDWSVEAALDDTLRAVMARLPDTSDCTRHQPELGLTADRPAARFAAWYEIFPRSQGTDPTRSATFREAERRIPAIADMGFDVLYMTPIHPIGVTNRKGPNNMLIAGPSDPGSPYAIGSSAGGHEAIAPELGTLADFEHFRQVAADHGLELALDFAINVSPDHPWVREHPEWFYHRPDGSIKYAENPPKKYEDIYPVNFRACNWQQLWASLRDIVLLWVQRGVRTFRVDNPHTKPLAFWEWLIADVHRDHPDVVFLSEAFTRPQVMKALAKAGFTQSYTYFTWRNTKWELTDYLTELTQTEMKEYFRGNFFANTPDILPPILQTGGRPAFRMRLVLAATLSSVYGIYSGFELAENTPREPGSEYYLDSEMYQHKVWDWNRPGNLIGDVRRVNQIRHENAALHQYDNLRFFGTDNDQLLGYFKATADRHNVILMIVNLDPFNAQAGWVDVPANEWGIGWDSPYLVHDLLSGERYTWHGNHNWVRLDPALQPAHILRVERT
jgi:starch synthase (maltosyl-transferring)